MPCVAGGISDCVCDALLPKRLVGPGSRGFKMTNLLTIEAGRTQFARKLLAVAAHTALAFVNLAILFSFELRSRADGRRLLILESSGNCPWISTVIHASAWSWTTALILRPISEHGGRGRAARGANATSAARHAAASSSATAPTSPPLWRDRTRASTVALMAAKGVRTRSIQMMASYCSHLGSI